MSVDNSTWGSGILVPTSPKSEASSATFASPSPYRRRFHGGTRREAWEKLMKKSPRQREPPLSPESNGEEDCAMTITELQQLVRNSSRGDDESINLLSVGAESISVKFRSSVGSEDEKKSFLSGNTTITTASSATQPSGYASLHDDSGKADCPFPVDDGEPDSMIRTSQLPQHLKPHIEEKIIEPRYYRVVYRGVVALVSRPDSKSQKSGAYVSFGEIIVSNYELEVEELESISTVVPGVKPPFSGSLFNSESGYTCPDSPPRSVQSHNAGSVSSLDTLKTASSAGVARQIFPTKQYVGIVKRAIRVDRVLTGGYAVDASESIASEDIHVTPKHSNSRDLPLIGSSPVPVRTSPEFKTVMEEPDDLGFLFTKKRGVAIVEELSSPPLMEHGKFIYQIVASTPVPILTGPCVDAPKTKATLLPGTLHHVCLRIFPENDNVVFLRLSHRRGWITDRKLFFKGDKLQIGDVLAVKEITHLANVVTNDGTVSVLSLTASSVSTSGSATRRRHRLPRRKQAASNVMTNTPLKPGQPNLTTTGKNQRQLQNIPHKAVSPFLMPEKAVSPSSNISVLSDDIFSDIGVLDPLTPDRSSIPNHCGEPEQSFPSTFLIRVNAPHGLNILDAPHFQVNDLIHGQSQPSSKLPLVASGGTQSNFQTMGQGFHAAHTTLKIGNSVVFDPVKKARILPRGALFEASKRMENSASFSQGAGLIKLYDGSGWAIVPKREELDIQYRNYHGGAASVKEGEAMRAFEEVGNAILNVEEGRFDHPKTVWVRVIARCGATVECPPPMPELLNDGEISPTSSTGNSSISGAGSNYGILFGQDSDVASSVGSAFLDAMFKTPLKKKVVETRNLGKGRNVVDKKLSGFQDTLAPTNVIACGMCVEVEKWESKSTISEKCVITQDFLRLCGGQGWIAWKIKTKLVAEIVPKPVFRFGSFWFRVLSPDGIRVRLGPSRRANSIKSEDDAYFRFECGEFLRASEVIIFFIDASPGESFAKLYRNRHNQMQYEETGVRPLSHMSSQAEWVQIYGQGHLYLEECAAQPQIQRHRDGWRYNIARESCVTVRKGPSFSAEAVGPILLPGKSILINERVMPPGERISWLRLKDGMGWVHDVGKNGETILIAHSLRNRAGTVAQLQTSGTIERNERKEIAYNTIVARLFTQQDDWEGKKANKMSESRKNRISRQSN